MTEARHISMPMIAISFLMPFVILGILQWYQVSEDEIFAINVQVISLSQMPLDRSWKIIDKGFMLIYLNWKNY
jgi:hypothetical protein